MDEEEGFIHVQIFTGKLTLNPFIKGLVPEN
jgi:hypothetical protein